MVAPVRGDFKVVTVLRAACLAPISAPAMPFQSSRGANTATTFPPTSTGTDETIYGVPVSAVQHCCGRGCKHCRIYWHRAKP